jgi:hypothetical protein
LLTEGIFQAQKSPQSAGFFVSGCLLLAEASETLLEFVDTATGINNFLLTSVERVACRTYVQVDSAWLGGLSRKHVTAGAGCFQGSVLRMNTVFHKITSQSSRRHIPGIPLGLSNIGMHRVTG